MQYNDQLDIFNNTGVFSYKFCYSVIPNRRPAPGTGRHRMNSAAYG